MEVLAVFAGISAVFFFLIALHFCKTAHLMNDLPTSKAQGVFIGVVELAGTAECQEGEAIVSPVTKIDSVCYRSVVEEEWGRWETELSSDGKGGFTTGTSWKTGWTPLSTAQDQLPHFYLKDDTGIIRIVPTGAELEQCEYINRICEPEDLLYYSQGFPDPIVDTTHKRRFREFGIPLHQKIYVVGRARVREDVVAAEIAADPESPLFMISVQNEEKLASYYEDNSRIQFILMLVSVCCMGLFCTSDILLALVSTMFAALFWTGCWTWFRYRDMVRMKNRVKRALANLDVEFKRRYDLIPQLAAVVSGMNRHETTVTRLLSILRAQGETLPTDFAYLEAVAPRLNALVERYPELRANELFLNLHKNLRDTETRIALAKNYYNTVAEYNNNYIKMFPDFLFAWLAGCNFIRPWDSAGFAIRTVPVPLQK
ncbi:MAG: LemA family protein [Planctomycetia bacterium]|nr:LemA family protein [Planctomycetia bacterium]